MKYKNIYNVALSWLGSPRNVTLNLAYVNYYIIALEPRQKSAMFHVLPGYSFSSPEQVPQNVQALTQNIRSY